MPHKVVLNGEWATKHAFWAWVWCSPSLWIFFNYLEGFEISFKVSFIAKALLSIKYHLDIESNIQQFPSVTVDITILDYYILMNIGASGAVLEANSVLSFLY